MLYFGIVGDKLLGQNRYTRVLRQRRTGIPVQASLTVPFLDTKETTVYDEYCMIVLKKIPTAFFLKSFIFLCFLFIFSPKVLTVNAQCVQPAPSCPAGYEPLVQNSNLNSSGAGWNFWTDSGTTPLYRGSGEVGIRAIDQNKRACWWQDYDPMGTGRPLDQSSTTGYESLYFAANVWRSNNATPGPYIAINRRFYYPKSSSPDDQIWCYNYGGDAPHSTGVYYFSPVNSCTTVLANTTGYIELNHPANAIRAAFCVWNTDGSSRIPVEGYVNWILLCGKRAPKVNGGYSNFGSCAPDSSCGPTGTYQTRQCNNPRPDNGGNYCLEDVNTKYCYQSTPDYLSDCCNVTETKECKTCTVTSTPTLSPTVTPPVSCSVTMQAPTAVRLPSSESDILINWQTPTFPSGYNLTGYDLQFRSPSGVTRSFPTIVVGINSFNHDTNAGMFFDDCGSYEYRVRSRILGCTNQWSNWSNSADSIINPPSAVSTTTQSCPPFVTRTNWVNTSLVATNFNISRTPPFGAGVLTLPISPSTFLDSTGLLVTESYAYRLQSINPARNCVSPFVSGNSVSCVLPTNTSVPGTPTPTLVPTNTPAPWSHPYCPR